ncbi:MAG: ubiquinone/menaquinone biosynthesis methyltransferase [Acidimicrobiales bacterium]|nr:ubiquinone/menaquinone biosynthesis methyltransferase [Hyphomonadaceae bacterium]RZV42008.1 MAG: ubiquinone/menaquinone biosynthesis methyltransferase [Acidimicrobiales bacterium]
MAKNSAQFDPYEDDVFARIASKYDHLCDIFSLGAHRLWKRKMSSEIAATRGGVILDMASGTGDIALRVASKLAKQNTNTKIIASDICPAMLNIAETKARTKNLAESILRFQILDAHDLRSIPDNTIDIYSLSFAMKICDREKLIPEALRILKPGGMLYCLEASHIPVKPIHTAYMKYMEWCIPVIARIATGGDRSAHDYLLKGIHEMPNQKAFSQELGTYGFENVSHKNLSLGIIALHRAYKPKIH